MTAEMFKKKITSRPTVGNRPPDYYAFTLSEDEYADIYNSLKRLEELEKACKDIYLAGCWMLPEKTMDVNEQVKLWESLRTCLGLSKELNCGYNPQPKYVLSRDIPSIGAKKGDKVELKKAFDIEFNINYEYYAVLLQSGFSFRIALKDEIKDGLIVEQKAREVYLTIRKEDNYIQKEDTSFTKPPLYVNYKWEIVKFVEVLNG